MLINNCFYACNTRPLFNYCLLKTKIKYYCCDFHQPCINDNIYRQNMSFQRDIYKYTYLLFSLARMEL